AGPVPVQVRGPNRAEVRQERLEERDQVAARVQAQHLELGAHLLGGGVLGKGERPRVRLGQIPCFAPTPSDMPLPSPGTYADRSRASWSPSRCGRAVIAS